MGLMRCLIPALGLMLAVPAGAGVFSGPDQVRPLLPGTKVPEFTVHDVGGQPVAVSAEKLEKPLVLTFYRGGWCPYCNLHLSELRRAEAELKEMGFEVWFISPDRPELLAEGEDAATGYRLFSDADASAARAFGVAFRLDDETHEQYLGYGVDINQRSGNEHQILPVASTFLIGTDGVVQFSYANPDYTVRLPPEVLLAAARAYRDEAQERLRRARN